MSYIDVCDVSYAYKHKQNILENVNLSLENGKFTAIVGANGSGKTTLGKLISGIIKPNLGEIFIDGVSTKKSSLGEIGGKIGYLFQNPEKQIFAHTVYEELAFSMKFKGIDDKTINEKVTLKLNEFGLMHLKDSFPFNLSQGEKQRLAIAAILINDVKYIVMDEPTTGLDIRRKEILSGIMENLKKKGIGFAVISHDDNFIKEHSDKTYVVKNRKVVEYARQKI
ncbi:energy-coupling factor ABC transporter ATP-binding protein [Abyssisolibacter fermentans]|uniref:energy-coupling factor ABC transporter ATP-binding protein n=1 Tax=Abyssisolibacter fermentans TaxID=1766203 RepID=UPI00192E49E4|nr:ABC transporter ATP-binding protein [Abyssisolibacter fermentans]